MGPLCPKDRTEAYLRGETDRQTDTLINTKMPQRSTENWLGKKQLICNSSKPGTKPTKSVQDFLMENYKTLLSEEHKPRPE